MIINQVTQISNQVRQMRTMTRQLTELEEQLDYMKEVARGDVDALIRAVLRARGRIPRARRRGTWTGAPSSAERPASWSTRSEDMGSGELVYRCHWRNVQNAADQVGEVDILELFA